MNRGDLVRAVSDNQDIPIVTVEAVLGSLLDIIGDTLDDGDGVHLRNFGKFEPRHKPPMTRRNPKTGEEIHVPDRRSVAFIPSPVLKERLNRNGHG